MLKYDQFICENKIEDLWKDIEEIGYILSDENIYYTIVQNNGEFEFEWRVKNSKILDSAVGGVLKMGRIIRRLFGSEIYTNLEISNLIKKINKDPNYIGTIIIHPSNTELAYKTTSWFKKIDKDDSYLEYVDRVEEIINQHGFKLEIENKVFLNIFK